MQFEILPIITAEEEAGAFTAEDLKELEEFIQANIEDRKYGGPVKKIIWAFGLFKKDGPYAAFLNLSAIEWQPKGGTLLAGSQFDWKKFSKLGKKQAVQSIRKECLNTITKISSEKSKPKDFN